MSVIDMELNLLCFCWMSQKITLIYFQATVKPVSVSIAWHSMDNDAFKPQDPKGWNKK